jgi:pyruvate dehydrogenase E2 component (dihydrolipoamide acetyltransferase)
VRKLARELGVDLASIIGTGPDGRIVEDDVRATVGGGRRVDLSPTRRAIATTLERQAAIPQVTTFRTLDATAVQALRADLGVSPLPIVVGALCATIRDHPLLNAGWAGDHLVMRDAVHVGLATDTERGLVVPVLRDAHTLGIAALASAIDDLAAAARDGSLTPDQVRGATFAVSNTGSYGSEAGTPILSPGTAVTLALGVIQERALVVDGAVVARPAATLSLTFDHRVLDGAAAGRALTDLVALLQSADRLGDLSR